MFGEEPSPGAFASQTLHSKRFEISERVFVVTFSAMSLVFAILGVILQMFPNKPTDFEYMYSSECPVGTGCVVSINVTEDLQHPVAIMYRVRGLWQNHLSIVTSRNDEQLRGSYVGFDEMVSCAPFRAIDDDPSPTQWILPCGLEANVMFNDTYRISGLHELGGPGFQATGVVVRDLHTRYLTGVKWLESDEGYLINELNLRLAVWMDTAAVWGFRRIWGMTTETGTLKSGIWEVKIESNWNSDAFDGDKSVIIAGSRNFPPYANVLGGLYVVASIIMFGSSVIVAICKRRIGEQT